MKRRLRCTFLVVLALLLAGGCDTAEQQSNFEDEAFSTPSGFTRTDVAEGPCWASADGSAAESVRMPPRSAVNTARGVV